MWNTCPTRSRSCSASSKITSLLSAIEAIGHLGAGLILQQAPEEELTEFLGRERYERRSEPVSYRHGYERVRVQADGRPAKNTHLETRG